MLLQRRVIPSPQIIYWLSIYLNQCGFMDIYFMSYNPILSLFTLLLKLNQPLETTPSWFLCPVDTPPLIFDVFLVSGHKMVQAHFVFLASHLLHQTFLWRGLFSFAEEWQLETRIWVVGTLTASRPSQQRGLRSICRYTTPVYFSIYPSVNILNIMNSYWYLWF